MARCVIRLVVVVGFGCIGGLDLIGWGADQPPSAPQVSAAQIEAWVRQLGDPDFRVREAATRALIEQAVERLDALAAVRRATASPDAETSRRAADILKAVAQRRGGGLPALRSVVRDLRPDLFVERAVRYAGDENHVWQAATDVGWAGRDYAVNKLGRLKNLRDGANPRRVFAGSANLDSWKVLSPNQTRASEEGMFLFRGREIHMGGRANGLILVADGPVGSEEVSIFFCFANGGVTQIGGAAMRVVVCDGPFTIERNRRGSSPVLGTSVVVANGDVRFAATTSVTDCAILAAGDVHVAEGCTISGSTILAGGRIHMPPKGPARDGHRIRDSRLEEQVPNPLTPFRFFELTYIGLEVEDADSGVRVEKTGEKKPAAVAGVQKGDVVVAVDGKKVVSVTGLRKQIRAGVARGDCTLTVRRGAESREIAVRFSD